MLWGLHSGGWMSGLIGHAEDTYRAQIDLLAEFGLHVTGWSAKELMAMEPGRREELAGWLKARDIYINLGVNAAYLSSDADELKRTTDAAIEAVSALAPLMRTKVCTTGIPRQYHHYSRDLPVAKQIDILSATMAPLAAACHKAGCPLGIHTVVHFGSDMAALCSRVPHLGLVFDTANPLLIGEPPLIAAEACAPYTIATHFKDHYATPNFKPLGLVARGAVPGQGDCCLREIYGLLMRKAPNPQALVMELEIDPVRDENDVPRDRREVLTEAVAFIRSLQ